MALKKQEFYEGAALHLLVRSGRLVGLRYEDPFFVVNGRVACYLKYCTRNRSPWAFTFTPAEQAMLDASPTDPPIVLGLVCGADGVAAVSYQAYRDIAVPSKVSIRVACHRQHREHYGVSGPDGCLSEKIAPADWLGILGC